MSHPFTGNIRELRNVMERAALFCDGDVIELPHIEQALAADAWASSVSVRAGNTLEATPTCNPLLSPLSRRHAIDRAALLKAVHSHRGSRAELAASLGISERSLYRKLKALGE
jgi:DNA-binding NtrC family response regulator